jgi:TP901 family phage tail tape measure protein
MAGSYNLGTAEGTIRINYDGKGAASARKDFDQTASSAKKSGTSMQEAGNKAGVASGLIAAGFAYAANKAIDFEKQISAIGAVSGATQGELEAMRKKALQLGADTSFSASQAANAMEELAKAGISTTDILNGAADATVALAAAGGIELADAATIAANAMNQFGLKAKDLPKVVDQIAGAANSSAIDVRDLGLSMQQAGAVAHLAGLSFEDTATAIALMGNAGIKGSDAGTSLKTFLQNLIPTTKQQIALMKQLGLVTKDGANKFFDASGKVKNLAAVSQTLKDALKGMTKEQQLNTLQILFGSDAIRAAAVLADNGADGFNKLADAMGKTTAADVAAARLNNTAGQLEQLKGSAETAAISLGTLLLPSVIKLLKGLTSLANGFTNLSPGTQKTIAIVAAVVGGILGLVFAITKIIAVVRAFQAVWIALNASFIATPIGAIITVIVLLIAAIYLLWTRSSAFRNFFIGIWNAIWSFLKTVGAWFAGPFANFFVSLWNKIFPVLKAIGAVFAAVFGFVYAVVSTFVKSVIGVINFLMPVFQAVFGAIVAIVKLAFSIMSAIFQVQLAIWKAVVAPVLNGIWIVIKFILGLIVDSWNRGWAVMSAIIQAVWAVIGPVVMTAVHLIWAMISAFLNTLQGVWNVVWGAIKATIDFIWGAITAVVSRGVQAITNIFNGIKLVVDKVRGFFNQLKDAASGGVGSLISFVTGIPGRILGALGNLASLLYDSGRRIIQGLIDGILNMAGKVKDAVMSVLNKARNLLPFSPAKEGPFSGKGWTLYSGQAISDALAKGILDHGDNAVKATLMMVSDIKTNAAAASPLVQQHVFGSPGVASSPTVNVPAPQVIVVADLGDGVRSVVRSEVRDNPGLVADANARGSQVRSWIASGR